MNQEEPRRQMNALAKDARQRWDVGRRIANIDGVAHTHTITTVYYDGG